VSERPWHFVRWPALAWMETAIKAGAFVVAGLGIAEGIGTRGAVLWNPVPTARVAVLGLLSLGLFAAIFDRWREREVLAMGFVVLSNAAHWGLFVALVLGWPVVAWVTLFAALMLAGDLTKIVFLRVHSFSVRGASEAKMIGLTLVYVVGYAAILALSIG